MFPGEIRLPKLERQQRCVIVNKPEDQLVIGLLTCDPENHVPQANVPDEGLGYVYFDTANRPMWQCAFCGATRRLESCGR